MQSSKPNLWHEVEIKKIPITCRILIVVTNTVNNFFLVTARSNFAHASTHIQKRFACWIEYKLQLTPEGKLIQLLIPPLCSTSSASVSFLLLTKPCLVHRYIEELSFLIQRLKANRPTPTQRVEQKTWIQWLQATENFPGL